MTTAPTPFFSFDLPLPPLPDSPAPRGLRFPGNPDPRPCSMEGNNVNATSQVLFLHGIQTCSVHLGKIISKKHPVISGEYKHTRAWSLNLSLNLCEIPLITYMA